MSGFRRLAVQTLSLVAFLTFVSALAAASIVLVLLVVDPSVLETAGDPEAPAAPEMLSATFAVAFVLASAALYVTFVALIAMLGASRPRYALVLALAVFIGVRLALTIVMDGSLSSDWLAHHNLALGWILGSPPIANRPMGYPIILGEAYRVLGAGPGSVEFVNLLASALGALLLAAWIGMLAGGAAAAVAVGILALGPSQALFVLLAATETVYATSLVAVALLISLAVRLLLRAGARWHHIALAGGAGIVLGASTYLRPTSLVIAPFVLLVPALLAPRSGGGRATLVGFLGLALALAPVVAINVATLDRWSVSTSLYAGWQLYVGTNVESSGRRTRADVERLDEAVGADPGTRLPREYAKGIFDPTTLREAADRDDVAMRLALGRFERDWPRLPLIAPVKVAVAWGPGYAPVGYISRLGSASSAASLAGQVWWVLVVAAAVAAMRRALDRVELQRVVVAAMVVPLAVSLIVLEVQPRYHEYVVPLIVGLAALPITSLVTKRFRAVRASPSAPPRHA